MNAFFSSPFAFIALLAVPALAAIYLLRNRFRIQHVSSLILWEYQSRTRQGGLNINRIQTPLLFLLELLTILLLTAAAAGPMIRSHRDARVFAIVLDNSFSMRAGDRTPREKAIKDIKRLLAESDNFQAYFILADQTPQLLGGGPVSTRAQANNILADWTCLSPVADLDGSIALGSELAGKTARILVVTDHEPESVPDRGRFEWWAFGQPLPNLAFVHASRTSFEGRDRCLLAVGNFSAKPVTTVLTLESLNGRQQIMRQPLELGPHETFRTFFKPDADVKELRARIEKDSLDIDNQVLLVAEPQKRLRVQVKIENEALRSSVTKALDATNSVRLTSAQPQLLFTDSLQSMPVWFNLWTVQLLSEEGASSYIGPFVVDYTHPLSEGLALEGVIWGAGKAEKFTGLPVIAAGNIPLVTDRETPTGSHNITVNLNPGLSTVLQSPNWPILIWNLVSWRSSFLPGFSQANLLLGSSVSFTKGSSDKELLLTAPDSSVRVISAPEETVLITPDLPGLYLLKEGEHQYELSVNAVSEGESDLTTATSGRWGKWQQAGLFWWEYRPVDWLLLLIALLLLTAHRYITAIEQKGAGL